MRILLACGTSPNQIALANRLAAEVDLVGVIASKNIPRKPKPAVERLRILTHRAGGRVVGRPLNAAWLAMQDHFRRGFPELPRTEILQVDNVNNRRALTAIESLKPDYVLVSGTNLVGRRVIGAAQRRGGILNLHTGISPYIKGGPNCTNWCLARGDYHLIGNTIMWLDRGIDTGALIATERTPLSGFESLAELHISVIEHGHDLYLRVLRRLAEGLSLPCIPQSTIARGVTYNTRDWSTLQMAKALLNFSVRYSPLAVSGPEVETKARSIRLVDPAGRPCLQPRERPSEAA